MRFLDRFKGVSSRIYVAFLVTAVVPAMVAGLVGIYYSLDALRQETLHHLDQEVTSRATGMARFFDQLTSELGEWIVAHAPIAIGKTLAERSDSSMEWSVALAFPRQRLFEAVFNLYILYGVLALALVASTVAGFLFSRCCAHSPCSAPRPRKSPRAISLTGRDQGPR